MMNGAEKERAGMTFEEYKSEVETLLYLLEKDLDTSTQYIADEWDDARLIDQLAFKLGVAEECIAQANIHIGKFEKTIKEKSK